MKKKKAFHQDDAGQKPSDRGESADSEQPHRNHRLSSEFLALKNLCEGKSPQLGVLLDHLDARGHSLLALTFSFPFLLPIPIPGLSVVFGLILAASGVAIALGRKPWLPARLLKRSVSGDTLAKVFRIAVRVSSYLEWFVRPRAPWLLHLTWIRVINGLAILLSGLLLSLPLPPGTNFPPALVVWLLSIAILEEDALLLILGHLVLILNFVFFTWVISFGAQKIGQLLGG